VQYTKAHELNPELPLPLYGMAQLTLHRDRVSKRTSEALSHLDRLLGKYPSNVDALRLKAAIITPKVGSGNVLRCCCGSLTHRSCERSSWLL
jgi:hypothetical protein